MGKITIYKCDWCKNVLSDREAGDSHLSLIFCEPSGVASRAGPLPGWRLDPARQIKPGVYHYCAAACLAQWTEAVLGTVQARQPTETA